MSYICYTAVKDRLVRLISIQKFDNWVFGVAQNKAGKVVQPCRLLPEWIALRFFVAALW